MPSVRYTSLAVLLGLLSTVTAAAVDVRQAYSESATYDYIIVGGGLSGLVVANRLTENANSEYDIV